MLRCHLVVLALLFLRSSIGTQALSFHALDGKKILVVGGSGRVGGSVVQQLLLVAHNNVQVVVGGTRRDRFEEARERWQRLSTTTTTNEKRSSTQSKSQQLRQVLQDIPFATVDREDAETVAAAIAEHQCDAVVHTAGPFQGKVRTPNGVIEACARIGIPYIDVCDDYGTARAAQTNHHDVAQTSGAPCIVSTGCWPGVSSLMAKQLVRKVLAARPALRPQDLSVDFSFFTAGSGGAGVTLLVATFLILAEKALQIKQGRRLEVDAMKHYTTINFGNIIGNRDVAPLNLLETASVHDVLGVGSVTSRFGTAPNFWNALLGAMAQLPSSLLANEDIMRKLSVFSMPIVRVVDAFAGATNSMRCDVTCPDDPELLRATAIYGHDNLEPCVGECVVAFLCAVLGGSVPPGVWFPEQAMEDDSSAVLSLASVGAHTTTVQARGLELDTRDVWGTPAAQSNDVLA